jgi:hypothetical protein
VLRQTPRAVIFRILRAGGREDAGFLSRHPRGHALLVGVNEVGDREAGCSGAKF